MKNYYLDISNSLFKTDTTPISAKYLLGKMSFVFKYFNLINIF